MMLGPLITMGLLLVANGVQKRIGEYGISVISKIMGLILAAYGLIRAYFHRFEPMLPDSSPCCLIRACGLILAYVA